MATQLICTIFDDTFQSYFFRFFLSPSTVCFFVFSYNFYLMREAVEGSQSDEMKKHFFFVNTKMNFKFFFLFFTRPNVQFVHTLYWFIYRMPSPRHIFLIHWRRGNVLYFRIFNLIWPLVERTRENRTHTSVRIRHSLNNRFKRQHFSSHFVR